MPQERGEAHSSGREPFDWHEGCLGLSQVFGKVRSSGQRWCEPIPDPSKFTFGVEDFPIQVDRGI